MKKAALHTLGCKVNSYETEAMQQLLENAGYEIVPFQEVADLYVINTCSVTNVADKKSRQMLHKAKKLNPDAIVVAAGCYVQVAKEQLLKDEAIDLIIGNNKKTDLVSIIEDYYRNSPSHEPAKDRKQREGNNYMIDISETQEYEKLSISKIAEHTRAFIKVQDGCNQFCSYCIIPYTRGRIRSREVQDIMDEVRVLVAKGYKEIVLTGIHLSSYGKDFECSDQNLLSLITALNQVDGLERIRLGSLEPRIITNDFALALSKLNKICPHFHLSLQSGSDRTLKRMNRHYTTQEYAAHCDILREVFDHPAITTDIIVGFPGETDSDFEETKRFVEQVGFYEMHVFKYSKREGTKAAEMPDQIPEPVKAIRSDQLIELNHVMKNSYMNRFIKKDTEVLLEELIQIDGQEYIMGHTREYLKAAMINRGEYKKGMSVVGTVHEIFENNIILIE